MTHFKVGQEVVCIDGDGGPGTMPLVGCVYEVRFIWRNVIDDTGRLSVALQLSQIPPERTSEGIRMGFYARRFRPLSIESRSDKIREVVQA